MDLIARAQAEVTARHVFFVNWFTGRADDGAITTSARAFSEDMQMIGPGGTLATKSQVVDMLQAARASRTADFAIQIEFQSCRMLGEYALIIYDEFQVADGARTARRSSALFSADDAAPEGVVWRYLQETWIAEQQERADRNRPIKPPQQGELT